MRHTLVAAFDTVREAQAAKSELTTKHIGEVKISASELDAGNKSHGSPTTADRSHQRDESFGEKVSDFFSSLFGDESRDKSNRNDNVYPEAYRRGTAFLMVKAANDELAHEAEAILERNGAIDIDERAKTWAIDGKTNHIAGNHIDSKNTGTVDRSGTTVHRETTDHAHRGSADEQSVPVINEDLRVGKREVNKGKVRVVSHVSEHPVEENVNLHEEHAHIERRPVDRAADPSEMKNFKSGSVEIQETEEQPVVEKRARVVEEVVVGKESSDREKTIRDTVRHTDVDIQNDATRGDTSTGTTRTDNDPLKNR